VSANCRTDPIETLVEKVRYRSRRVKNWKSPQQVVRRTASSILLHEKKLRRVKGHRQMPLLIAALENWNVDDHAKVA
jgi:hypothetical protein